MYSSENNTDNKYSLLSPYLMYSSENNTDNKYSLLSPYLMYSTENNTDNKYSLLSPYLMYSTENNTDSITKYFFSCILMILVMLTNLLSLNIHKSHGSLKHLAFL